MALIIHMITNILSQSNFY